MKELNEAALQFGDIILTTSTALVSKVIRAATRSDISHAMVYVEDRSVIDATAEGVQARNTQRLLFEDGCSIYALRARNGLSADEARGICQFVRSRVGTEYSKGEAVRSARGGSHKFTKKQFCSRLVAQAYASVGIDLVRDPNYCAPADLKNSALLIPVPDAVVPVSADVAARWDAHQDITQMMRDVTNAILDGARRKDKDIQSLDDLIRHLADHPGDDEYVLGLLEASGYLTLWSVEKDNNPWQYDLSLMASASADGFAAEIEEYCRSVLANVEEGPHRYVVNHGAYARLASHFGLRTFQALRELYAVLAALHRTRINVATNWLVAAGRLQPVAETCPRPHTPEWFAALQVWNPPQATHTEMIIEKAGSIDVCSICGDEPADDYSLADGSRPPGGADALRLCGDCVRVRRASGEPFMRLSEGGEIGG